MRAFRWKREETSLFPTIILVRHGESYLNRENPLVRVLGKHRRFLLNKYNPSLPMTPKGEAQARTTGQHIRKKFGVPAACYSSPYLRTQRTAELILDAYPPVERQQITYRVPPFLREAGFFETPQSLFSRAERFLKIVQDHTESPILVIGHAGSLRYLRFLLVARFEHRMSLRALFWPIRNCEQFVLTGTQMIA